MNVNELYIGTVNIPGTTEEIVKWLRDLYSLGYRQIDTAWIYGSSKAEKELGKALRILKDENISFKLQTKVWTSRFKEVEKSLKEQMEALGVDYIDSYMLHRPSMNFEDDVYAWKKLIEFKEKGLVGSIGVSNYEKDMIKYLIQQTGVKPEFNQIEISVTNLREDRIHFAKQEKIALQAWSVMGSDTAGLLKNKVVNQIAKKHKVNPSVVIISYPYNLGATPIVTSLKIERMESNKNLIKLSEEDMELLRKENTFSNKYEEIFPY